MMITKKHAHNLPSTRAIKLPVQPKKARVAPPLSGKLTKDKMANVIQPKTAPLWPRCTVKTATGTIIKVRAKTPGITI